METVKIEPREIRVEDVRAFLSGFRDRPHVYAHYIKALRRFFRDFLNRPDVMSTFRFPAVPSSRRRYQVESS